MKVAINKCYGGFGLSNEAIRAFLTLKGIEFDEDYKKPLDLTHFYHKGYLGAGAHYISRHVWEKDRSDKDLIKVIEDLGELANGRYAKLRIVEIPDDVKYEIDEYDGFETIKEVHRSWN